MNTKMRGPYVEGKKRRMIIHSVLSLPNFSFPHGHSPISEFIELRLEDYCRALISQGSAALVRVTIPRAPSPPLGVFSTEQDQCFVVGPLYTLGFSLSTLRLPAGTD